MSATKYLNHHSILSSAKKTGLFLSVFASLFLVACKKEGRMEQYPLSISFYNGLSDGTSRILTGYGEQKPATFIGLYLLNNGTSREYVTLNPSLHIQFYKYPDTLAKDPPIISKTLSLNNKDIYSYLIYGSAPNIKEKLIKETIPGYAAHDSVSNFRFINLFENRSIDIFLTAPETKTLATNLPYEEMTQFISLKSNRSISSFTVEFRDHATGVLLVNKQIQNVSNTVLFKSNSHVLNGVWRSETDFTSSVGLIRHF